MSGFEKDFTVKIEREDYEVIQNVDVKQEIVDVNVNYYQSTSNESYWKKKCDLLERKLTNMEKQYSGLKAKKATPAPAPSKPKGPYSDPLLKAFFCPKLPEEELAELRKEKRELIAHLASMKDENIQVGFQKFSSIDQNVKLQTESGIIECPLREINFLISLPWAEGDIVYTV